MASPLEAIGAAAAILQLVDFGVKLSKRAVQIYVSGKGKTQEAQDVEAEMLTFKRMSNSLIARYDPRSGAPASMEEKDIAATAERCNELVKALLHELNELAVKGPRSAVKSLLSSVKIETRQPKIEGLRKQLEVQRVLLREQIANIVSNQTTFIAREIRKLDQISDNLAKYQQQVLDALDRKNDDRLEQRLRRLQEEGENVLFRREILASLRYKELGLRSGQIKPPTEGTHQWIFETAASHPGSSLRFLEWLENDNGIYWVTGKAGSGKSTLMKHVYNDPRTETALQTWAGSRLLVKGSHYFWYTGFKMQKSYEGLLQSILYDVLRAVPGLIDTVCASRRVADILRREAGAAPWTLSDLLECMDVLTAPDLAFEGRQICLCFFIDGLDEYEGDDDQVVHVLHRFAQSEHTKVCAASRPWPKFELSFAESVAQGKFLMLHEYTRDDIRKQVDKAFDGHAAVKQNIATLTVLKSEIVEKSQGVFLWVTLVIGQLIKGFEYADDVETLRSRLRQIPSELKDYFGVIFDRIDKTYEKETPKLFLTCMRAAEPVPVLMFDLIIDQDMGPLRCAMEQAVAETSSSRDQALSKDYRAKVSGRCHDLLEVEHITYSLPALDWDPQLENLYGIKFLHQTVQDYFSSSEMLERLTRSAGGDFDSVTTLVAGYVYFMKRTAADLNSVKSVAFYWAAKTLFHAAWMTDFDAKLTMIQELDKTMSAIAGGRAHWTNNNPDAWVEFPINAAHLNSFKESGGRDIIGHLIDLGFHDEARVLLARQPLLLQRKSGRPYLDYALRSFQAIKPACQYVESVPRQNYCMVKSLLDMGCDPNEVIHMYNHRTVWATYIIFLGESSHLPDDAREIAWLLIDRGAKDFAVMLPVKVEGGTTSKFRSEVVPNATECKTMDTLLERIFGVDEAMAMTEAANRNSSKGWGKFLKRMVGLST